MDPKGWARGWRAKAALQQAISRCPRRDAVNLWLQRHVTHGIPVKEGSLRAAAREVREHLAGYRAHALGDVPLAEATFYEFGAGSDLRHPLVLHAMGVGRQVEVDLSRLVRRDLVDDACARLAALPKLAPEAAERLRATRARAAAHRDLDGYLAAFGIDYRAPADARATGLPDGSIDCITSTTALEHIPPDDIAAILAESLRILRPGGVASFIIDHSDHFSHRDPTITPYNFLRFDERTWRRRYSTPLGFQNRLRHSEYGALFRASGFEVVADEPREVTDEMREQLRSVPLDERFRAFDEDDLVITGALVVLRAPA